MEKGKEKRRKRIKAMVRHKVYRVRNILTIVCISLAIVLLLNIINLKFIPTNYISILMIIMFLITVISTILINLHGKKPLKAIGYVLLTILILFDIIAIYSVTETNKFFKNGFSANYNHYQSSYYVLTKSTNSENQPDGYIGVYNSINNKEEAIKKLSNKYNLKAYEYNTSTEAIYALNNNLVKYILIDKKLYNELLTVKYNYDAREYKIVYEYDIYNKKEVKEKEALDKFNVYLEVLNTNGLSDYNILLTVNMEDNKIQSTVIPNNTYMQLATRKNSYDKLQNLPLYDDDEVYKSIESLLGIDIDYNVKINENSLLTTLRSRKIEYNGKIIDSKEDIEQLINDNEFSSIIKKVFASTISEYNPTQYSKTLNTINNVYETNMPKDLIFNMISKVFSKQQFEVSKETMTGTEANYYVFLTEKTDTVIVTNPQVIYEIVAKIKETLN